MPNVFNRAQPLSQIRKESDEPRVLCTEEDIGDTESPGPLQEQITKN